ncbi:acidic leucine-rich nuclear phosphoprotein 32 family member B-like [Acropora millepora]|uniref:acidic leucine-rich nuclear phosphoprotein 32 family member B-like n=1 Tax=Acropora millepora TaxID=45264 RepID=UPI001CF287FF|nr:acidic leucine-rich nuclear phosphoprotein 32 family member B-like [Acropora millepora]
MMHCCQFCGIVFSHKFNRDRHEGAHCSKRFDDEEGMTSFPNDEESIEQRTEKYYEDDDEEKNSTGDGDEADDHDEDEEGGDGGEETNNGETGSHTENEEVDTWDIREEAISDMNSAWEEEVQENLCQGLP